MLWASALPARCPVSRPCPRLLRGPEGEVLVPVVDAKILVSGDHHAAVQAGSLADNKAGTGVGTGAKQGEQGGREKTQGVFFIGVPEGLR